MKNSEAGIGLQSFGRLPTGVQNGWTTEDIRIREPSREMSTGLPMKGAPFGSREITSIVPASVSLSYMSPGLPSPNGVSEVKTKLLKSAETLLIPLKSTPPDTDSTSVGQRSTRLPAASKMNGVYGLSSLTTSMIGPTLQRMKRSMLMSVGWSTLLALVCGGLPMPNVWLPGRPTYLVFQPSSLRVAT